jgi:hypothetical protein
MLNSLIESSLMQAVEFEARTCQITQIVVTEEQ